MKNMALELEKKNYFHGKHPKTQFVQTQRHTLTMEEIIKAAKWTPSFVMLTLTALKALKKAAEGVVCCQPLGLQGHGWVWVGLGGRDAVRCPRRC